MFTSRNKLFFLLFFAAFAAGVGFFHIETGLSDSTRCPACQFQQTTLCVQQVLLFILPFVLLLLRLEHRTAAWRNQPVCTRRSSRAPPRFR